MWNIKKSINLSLIACFVVSVLVVLLMVFLPQLISVYAENRNITELLYLRNFILNACLTIYPSAVLGLVALYSLIRMLLNIKADEVFIAQNVSYLRTISWCCFAVFGIAALGGIFYVPFFAVSVAAGFVGLILRVVKNVMQTATKMREESELTI